MGWNNLSVSQRAQLINQFRDRGITDISEMRRQYDIQNPEYTEEEHPFETAPMYASGGKIHINPKNKGKFNALLKRTGKSASWFKEHGTPLQKKRAIFALNARKWKHADGGYLFEDGGDTGSDWEKKTADYLAGNAKLKEAPAYSSTRKEMFGNTQDYKRSVLGDKEGRTRAEFMARYSGGIGKPEDIFILNTNLPGIADAFNISRRDGIYRTNIRPKRYLEERGNLVNYGGVMSMDSPGRRMLSPTEFTSRYEDDFVSALFNDNMPLRGSGMVEIKKGTRPQLRRLLGRHNPDVVKERSFRSYQTNEDTLSIAPILDSLANRGLYSLEKVEDSTPAWRLDGNDNYRYDPHNHTKISIVRDGKKHSKNVDIFDVKGLGRKGTLERRMTDFITKYAKPYVVTTPWYVDTE